MEAILRLGLKTAGAPERGPDMACCGSEECHCGTNPNKLVNYWRVVDARLYTVGSAFSDFPGIDATHAGHGYFVYI